VRHCRGRQDAVVYSSPSRASGRKGYTINPTDTLASFTSALAFEDIPPPTRLRALQVLIDTLASSVIGRTGDELGKFENAALAFGGEGPATVIAAPQRLSLAGAVLLNGYQVTAVNVCDVYRPAHCHMTPVVVPPALAVAEQHHLSGRELITGLVAGLETACRVGLAINFEAFRERGWHSPGVIGPFGGAAAVGRLLGLSAADQLNALGLAGSQSAGTVAHWGTPTIKFHQARGSVSGLLAGLMAAEGLKAGDDVLADPSGGLLVNYSDGGDPGRLTDGLGERWEFEQLTLKRWPSGSGVQTTVTSLLTLIDEHDLQPGSIEQVRVFLPSHAFKLHGTIGWDGKFTAMLSARFITSVVLHDRRCWVDQFEADRREDPAVDAFARDRVEIIEDAALRSGATVTEVQMADGSLLRDARSYPKGDPEDPLSLEEILDKFRDAAGGRLGPVDQLIDQLLSVEDLADVAPLIGSLGTGSSLGRR